MEKYRGMFRSRIFEIEANSVEEAKQKIKKQILKDIKSGRAIPDVWKEFKNT